MEHSISRLAIAAALAFATVAALADSATQEFTGVGIHLIDLDPGDGIAPSVVFEGSNGSSLAVGETAPGFHVVRGQHAFDPVSVSERIDGFAASSSLSGDIFAGTMSLQGASRSPSGVVGYANSYVAVYFDDVLERELLPFRLSPHTELIASGLATVDVALGVPMASQGFSQVGLFVGIDGTLVGEDQDRLLVDAGIGSPGTRDSASAQRLLSVSLSNDGSDELAGIFGASGYTFLTTFTASSAVPEPATIALALAGLGGFVVASRRDRRCCRPRPQADWVKLAARRGDGHIKRPGTCE